MAICLELGLASVADAVLWADEQIALSHVPHVALCDVAMASRRNELDIAAMLRQLPGDYDPTKAINGVLQRAAEALRTRAREPRLVASALFQLAMDDNVPPGALRNRAWWFYDAIDLAESGYIAESSNQVIHEMQRILDEYLAGDRREST